MTISELPKNVNLRTIPLQPYDRSAAVEKTTYFAVTAVAGTRSSSH